ncbi:hypothetical protein [Rickettsia gravesii]|uniref:hypothetical protein n=1 Tax=Rickettsia gravesii TaxID=354585 RepID=UPI00037E3A4D|nr:hypothetical protein [Rickettsia gravesii]
MVLTIFLGVKYSPKSFSVDVVFSKKYSNASPFISVSIVDKIRGSISSIMWRRVMELPREIGVKTSPPYLFLICSIT